MHSFTVTLNTADSEFNDIEFELDASSSIDTILARAVEETDITLQEVSSYVIVGVPLAS